jgi:Leucine-rich repeat (LRR) protein
MGSWIESEERLSLAAKLHEKLRKIKQKQDRDDAAVEEDEKDALWRTACDDGKSSGEIRLCWRDLKHISSRVYTFQASHGRALHKLVLDGIGLSTLEGICEHCPDLIHLSLASNEISDVTGIHILCKLSHLNLLRNNLTHLPPNIGLLGNLNRLEIANNKLVELPTEIEMLSRLKYLNLECNELSVLPSSFGRLKCETVCLNSNNFKVFPDR